MYLLKWCQTMLFCTWHVVSFNYKFQVFKQAPQFCYFFQFDLWIFNF
jgi:hypothetical protein